MVLAGVRTVQGGGRVAPSQAGRESLPKRKVRARRGKAQQEMMLGLKKNLFNILKFSFWLSSCAMWRQKIGLS